MQVSLAHVNQDPLTRLRAAVRDIPDFPKPGILFRDITPILGDPDLLRLAIDAFADASRPTGVRKIVGIDARGFLFGTAVAYRIGAGFVPVRKKGKLPHETEAFSYSLEYGEATVEMHKDAIAKGERVILIDDLLATGGTAAAAIALIEKLGGEVVEAQFLIELEELQGRGKLGGHSVRTFIKF